MTIGHVSSRRKIGIDTSPVTAACPTSWDHGTNGKLWMYRCTSVKYPKNASFLPPNFRSFTIFWAYLQCLYVVYIYIYNIYIKPNHPNPKALRMWEIETAPNYWRLQFWLAMARSTSDLFCFWDGGLNMVTNHQIIFDPCCMMFPKISLWKKAISYRYIMLYPPNQL